MDMMEMQIPQFPGICPPAEGGDQGMRHIGDAAQMDVVVGFHDMDGLVGGHILYRTHSGTKIEYFFIILQIIHEIFTIS